MSDPARTLLEKLEDKEDAKTKAELAEETGKSTRQIGRLLDELEDAQLINKQKRQKEGPGRLAWEYWKAITPNVEDIELSEGDLTEWLTVLPDIEKTISDISDTGLELTKIKRKKIEASESNVQNVQNSEKEGSVTDLKKW